MVGVRESLTARAGMTLLAVSLLLTEGMLLIALCGSALAAPPKYDLIGNFGPDGTEASGFVIAGPNAVDQQTGTVYVVDRGTGKLYKFGSDGGPVDWGGAAGYISGNEISGLTFPVKIGETQVAVDSSTHTVYVTSENSIRAFLSNGEEAEFTAGPGAGSSVIAGFSRLAGVAVDANGFIYAGDDEANVVKIYASSGEEITNFSVEDAANLAVDSNGAVYVNRRLESDFSTVLKFTPSSFPVTGSTTYTAAAEPVDSVASYTVAVDPATNQVYIARVFGFSAVAVYDEGGTLLTTFAESGSPGEVTQAEGIAVAGGSEGDGAKVYVSNAPDSGLSQVRIFQLFVPKPGPPVVEQLVVGDVSSTSASLQARINAALRATSYRFEYGLADCSVSVCTAIPVGGNSIGAGTEGVGVAQDIQGLQPNTEYHYRVVAENELGSDEMSGLFGTQSTDLEFELSDARVWEMVSPPNKRGAQLLGSQKDAGALQAAADGNSIAYGTRGSIEAEPKGSRMWEVASVLARRDNTEWHSEDITPPNKNVAPLLFGQQGEYKLFSQDLSRAILDPRDGTELSAEASERAPYLRANGEPPLYKPLVTGKEGFANVPPGTEFGGGIAKVSAVTIQNANPSLTHVVLNSGVSLVEGAPSHSIYEWVNGEIQPIAVLPASEGGMIIEAESGSAAAGASLRNAISDDGSRVFWTGNDHLYMRDMEVGESARIDVVQSGTGAGEVNPVFQGASADGSVVFFTDEQQLTEGASPVGSDLYRCEIDDPSAGCVQLVDLTAPLGGSGESAEVQGLVSALSDDGSSAYFVASGVLATDANKFGDAAAVGEPNLYLWQEGEGLRFVATLGTQDSPDWGLAGAELHESGLSAASSPSGRYFAFMSERNLTHSGPNAVNLDVATGESVEQVYRYDALADRLDCVSCAPTGASPRAKLVVNGANPLVDPREQWGGHRAAAILPQPVTINSGGPNLTIYSPRAVLDNGRVFFNGIDALVPGDSNAQWDVYQYEDLGRGDCDATSGNAAIVRSAEGCIALMSSGTGTEEAGFLDASAIGDDAFFLTPARLSVTDGDDETDVYDARVGGKAAVLDPSTECTAAESCHPASQQLPEAAPASASFTGSGNLKMGRKKCPKGKRAVKQGGRQRCVPRKGKKHHRRAGGRKEADR